MRTLADAGWPDLPEAPLLVVPLGSVEQHGPHLPLTTDTAIADAVARAAVPSLGGALLAPALAYGASGEHEGFPGTISIGTAALTGLLVEYGRSACRWAAGCWSSTVTAGTSTPCAPPSRSCGPRDATSPGSPAPSPAVTRTPAGPRRR